MDKQHHAVAIGASSGGIEVLMEIAASLPRNVPAIVLVTQHIGAYPSILPELMRARGPNGAMHPQDGDEPLPGTIYIAPPDYHMLVEQGRLRLLRGPKENHARPAIDPMFRSVALAFRSHAIGVVLSGRMDDGTAGLKAIKECGGVAIVQDPATALESAMPASALANVDVDLCLRVDAIVPAILKAIHGGAPRRATAPPPERLGHEQSVLHASEPMENLDAVGKPSGLTCPDCGGGLWELKDTKPLRYRCHTGHAYSSQSLAHAQGEVAEHALWSSVRSLQEKEILLRRVAMVARAQGDHAQAQVAEERARQARRRAEHLVRVIEEKGHGSA